MTPFRSEKNSNWEGAYRVPAMVRWPGKIKPGQVSNEIVAHLDWLPTFLAMAGEPDVKDKLLKGYKVGDMTYKVHLDGDNLVPYLTGKAQKSPRESFFYINDDQQLTGPALRQLEDGVHGAAGHRNAAHLGGAVHQPAGSEDLQSPHRPVRAGGRHLEHLLRLADRSRLTCWCPRRTTSASSWRRSRNIPQRQKAASFNLDEVMEKLKEGPASKFGQRD